MTPFFAVACTLRAPVCFVAMVALRVMRTHRTILPGDDPHQHCTPVQRQRAVKKTVWGGERRGDCRLAPARSRPSPNKAWARKSPVTNLPAHDGMASIVIPCWNQLEFTRFCKFAHKWGLPEVGQRMILRAWAQGGNGPQMTQMDADEETTCGNAQQKNGRRNEPTGRPGPFHLRSSA